MPARQNFAGRARDEFRAFALCASVQHVNKGGTCRGPCLEAECTGGMRCFCFPWRDLAGGILVQEVNDDAKPIIAGVKPGKGSDTGESYSPVSFFCLTVITGL